MSIIVKLFGSLIRLYQYLISPYFGSCCRFTPSCSDYALEALAKKGVMRGLLYIAWRLMRCHPFAKGGYDPVDKEHCNTATY